MTFESIKNYYRSRYNPTQARYRYFREKSEEERKKEKTNYEDTVVRLPSILPPAGAPGHPRPVCAAIAQASPGRHHAFPRLTYLTSTLGTLALDSLVLASGSERFSKVAGLSTIYLPAVSLVVSLGPVHASLV